MCGGMRTGRYHHTGKKIKNLFPEEKSRFIDFFHTDLSAQSFQVTMYAKHLHCLAKNTTAKNSAVQQQCRSDKASWLHGIEQMKTICPQHLLCHMAGRQNIQMQVKGQGKLVLKKSTGLIIC